MRVLYVTHWYPSAARPVDGTSEEEEDHDQDHDPPAPIKLDTTRPAYASIVGAQLTSRIYPVRLPLEPDERRGWKAYPVFGSTSGGGPSIACHVSVLMPGRSPHPPHAHAEEELLLLLAGEVELLLAGRERARLRAGEFVYYPARYAHTLQTTSTDPAMYVMFKWREEPAADSGPALSFGRFDTAGPPGLLFESPTGYLGKLHSHVTLLEPGDGYPPHADDYDVAIVVLAGEVETIGAWAEPYDVIYYAAGEAHGMHNVGDVAARYVVFEFHASPHPARRRRTLSRLLGR